MEVYGGWSFPKGERHLQGWMKTVQDFRANPHGKPRLLYQGSKYRLALRFVKQRRNAIDVGGHIGLWSWQMVQDFNRVWTFEPMPEHRECFAKNMQGFSNYTLFDNALGNENKPTHIRTRTVGSSGDTGIDLEGNGTPVQMRKLDEFELNDIDFMKIDCEGFELFVLQGGLETVKRNKPCIIVEQKPETGMVKNYNVGTTDAVKLLLSLGAIQRGVVHGDYILSWNH